MTKVVNLIAGPGAGKSTTAAHLFALMKHMGMNVELVTEYAKELFWDKTFHVMEDEEIYIFAEQLHRIKRLLGKVDYIIIDSPLILSLYYGRKQSEAFKTLVMEQHLALDSLNVFLKRLKPYNPIGRRQSEDSSKSIDVALFNILCDNGLHFEVFVADEDAASDILSELLNQEILKEKQI